MATKSNTLQSREPLTDAQMMAVAPSIFASEKHGSRSERYAYIPTIEVLTGLRKEGFQPFMVAQSRTRLKGHESHTKHMLRLRHASSIKAAEASEVILINSHNGSSSYQMIAGKLRFVCMNGLIVGENIDSIRIPHQGDVTGRVIEGAWSVLRSFDVVDQQVIEMKQTNLIAGQAEAFATAALALRYDEGEKVPVTAAQVLRPRRREDTTSDLWATFNRVQENVIQGGLSAAAANGRRATTRPVRSIDNNVRLNRALWVLSEEMAKLVRN